LKIVNKIPYSDWDNFISSHPNGTVFQSPGIYEFFKKIRRFDPLLLAAFDKNDNLSGVLVGIYIYERNGIGKLLSTRFVIYGGPLLTGSDETKRECLDSLLKILVSQTAQKALFIQFRNYFSWEGFIPVFEKYGFNYLERMNFIIKVPDTGPRIPGNQQPATSNQQQNARKSVLKNMSAGRRRQLERGLRSGAEIIEPEGIDQVKEFYDILYKLYRYKVRKPLADWSFFENFFQFTSPAPEPVLSLSKGPPSLVPRPSIGIIRLVKYDGRIIGGILSPVFEKKCIYEWYVCGLDKEYKEQYPSVLATWAALEYAINNNIESFDFMGVGKPDVPYGVRDFKARFGGELVNYGRLTRINNKFLYNIAELGYNVLAVFKKI